LPWKDIGKLAVAGLTSLFAVYSLSIFTTGLLLDIALIVFGATVYLLLLVPLKFYAEEDVRMLSIMAERFPKIKKYVDIFIKIIT